MKAIPCQSSSLFKGCFGFIVLFNGKHDPSVIEKFAYSLGHISLFFLSQRRKKLIILLIDAYAQCFCSHTLLVKPMARPMPKVFLDTSAFIAGVVAREVLRLAEIGLIGS